jgi:DNA/RNA endonuclease YhcR with UshA esterase domain
VPNGNGNIVALYTVFGNTKQLTIRDTADLKLWGARCGSGGGGGGGGGGTGTLTDISAIRALLTGTTATIPASTKITGVVISDKTANNIQSQNIIVQQGDGLSGIVVRFASATPAHNFNTGDSIDVVISGATLGRFSGVMQVSNVPLANVTLVSTGKTINPRVATVAQVNANQPGWESTLVKILNVTIAGTGTNVNWSGTTKFSDGTGTIDHFTRTGATGATFANSPFPTGVRASATAIVSKFNATNQITIRNPADVQ